MNTNELKQLFTQAIKLGLTTCGQLQQLFYSVDIFDNKTKLNWLNWQYVTWDGEK